jgi:putative tricarboxylic transport membrane protein
VTVPENTGGSERDALRPAGHVDDRPTISRGQRTGEFIFAGLALAMGVFVLVGAWSIRAPGAGSTVGPRLFPYLVGGILIAASAMVIVELVRGRFGQQDEGEDVDLSIGTDWITLAKLAGFVAAHIALIGVIGWPLAAALLFGGVAWSLGAKKWWMALLVGLIVAMVVQVVFGGLLGLSLPLGPLLSWLEPLLRSIGVN